MPSPMNLSSVPSYLKIVSTISSKYSLSISTSSSGRVFSLIAVKPRMSLLNTVHCSTRCPPGFTSSWPLMTRSAMFGESRRLKRSRVTISFSTFLPRMLISMNIAAWLAMAVTSSRSLGWNWASVSESSQRTPSTSLLWRSGATMAELIRFRIMLLPFEAAKSIAASCVRTAARSFTTWFRMVDETLIGACVPSRRCEARGVSSPSSSRRKMTPRSARMNLKTLDRIFSSSLLVSRSAAISRESSCERRRRS